MKGRGTRTPDKASWYRRRGACSGSSARWNGRCHKPGQCRALFMQSYALFMQSYALFPHVELRLPWQVQEYEHYKAVMETAARRMKADLEA